MTDYSDLDPAALKPSLSDGTDLKPSITTDSYSGGTPSAPGDLKPSIVYPDGRVKEGLLHRGFLNPSVTKKLERFPGMLNPADIANWSENVNVVRSTVRTTFEGFEKDTIQFLRQTSTASASSFYFLEDQSAISGVTVDFWVLGGVTGYSNRVTVSLYNTSHATASAEVISGAGAVSVPSVVNVTGLAGWSKIRVSATAAKRILIYPYSASSGASNVKTLVHSLEVYKTP
jgi:hypothetical protein